MRLLSKIRCRSGGFPARLAFVDDDEIHPNMASHRQIAAALAQTITRTKVTLDQLLPGDPALQHTLSRLHENKAVQILAMPPLDALVGDSILKSFPAANLAVESWPVAGLSLAQIEQQAKDRVRKMKPDLVLISISRDASCDSDQEFQRSYAWIMNWSLNFGAPTWDVVVVHPQVWEPTATSGSRDETVRKLVQAQDLHLIDRQVGNLDETSVVLDQWFRQQLAK